MTLAAALFTMLLWEGKVMYAANLTVKGATPTNSANRPLLTWRNGANLS